MGMLSLPPVAMHLLVLDSNYAKKLSHAGESCTGQLEAKRGEGGYQASSRGQGGTDRPGAQGGEEKGWGGFYLLPGWPRHTPE